MILDRRAFLHSSLLAALGGCASQGPYRTNADICPATAVALNDCAGSSHIVVKQPSGRGLEYSIGIVEFDDQGVLLSEEQMWLVFNQLRMLADSGRDLSIVVYVHGWHHNADAADQDFASFSRLLAELAALEAVKATRRRVAGIYAAWPGLGITVPGIKYAGFWTRKEAAERVAQGSILELFAQARGIWNGRREKQGDSRLVIIGHSFGGLIVYEALRNYFVDGASTGPTESDVYEERIADPVLNRKVAGYGNLVVLVNPAVEGVRYEVINRIVNERTHFNKQQKPVLAIFASRNDYPVRYLFPTGRWVSTSLQQVRSENADKARERNGGPRINEAQKVVYGVGYVHEFRTHTLDLGTPPDQRFAGTAAASHDPAFVRQREAFESQQHQEFITASTDAHGFLKSGWKRRYTDGAVLAHVGKMPTNPFWVVSVDSSLINGHNGIWSSPEWMDFLRQLYDETVDHPAVPV
jgi:hypothetical protein